MAPERALDAQAMEQPPRLVGRQALLRNLLARLGRGQSLLLYAGPKLGKTCLLRYVAATLNRERPGAAAYVNLAEVEDPARLLSIPVTAEYVLFDGCDRLLRDGGAEATGALQRWSGRAAVWAGGRTWRDFVMAGRGSALPALQPVPLAVLLPGEARELASPGLPPRQVDWVLGYGGTHPYVIEVLRAELLRANGGTAPSDVLHAATERLSPCFTACVQALQQPNERRLLDHLIHRGERVNPQAAAQALDAPSVKRDADVLAYLGLISRWNLGEGAALQASCALFNAWYRSRDAAPPRYSPRPLPAYRYLPGRSPHPRRDPRGHSYGSPEPVAAAPSSSPGPGAWQESDWYLYGADLFNRGFWWEAHEAFESLWNAAGHDSPAGQFFQALVHVAGAGLKRELSNPAAAARLADHGLRRLDACPATYMGLDVAAFAQAVRLYFREGGTRRPVLRLAVTSRLPAGPG